MPYEETDRSPPPRTVPTDRPLGGKRSDNPFPPFPERGGTGGFASNDSEIARSITSITPSISFSTWRSS